MKKKKNRRSNTKYPGLRPDLNLKTRYDLLDQDYITTLPDKKIKHCSNAKGDCKICNNPKTAFVNPLEYLNDFNEEYVNDKLDRKNLSNNKHNTPALKKDCDDRNNSRNRCILTQQKASGRMVDYEKIQEMDYSVNSPEEEMMLKQEIALKKKKRKK
jgi:hypothetical protein